MIWLGQTSSNLDTPQYFSSKYEATSAKRQTLPEERDYCVCLAQCVPDLKVFTDGIGTDELKNDWSSFIMRSANGILYTGAIQTLKIVDADTGAETTLVDPTHGTYYQTNGYVWFKLDWYKVFVAIGLGRYYIHFLEVGTTNGETINEYKSPTYRLMNYSDQVANGTVVIESFNQGKLHHGNNYSNLTTQSITEPFPFHQRTRLPGRLIKLDDDVENDHLVLDTENRPSYQIKDQMAPKFRLLLERLTPKRIAPVVFEELFGSEIYVTDYNLFNHATDPRDFQLERFIDVPVRRQGNAIAQPSSGSVRKTYEIELIYEYDNVFKTNN